MNAASLKAFLKRETVLCAALLLAVASCFFVPPDGGYIAYIDFRTLSLLFCLMAVMAGLRTQGVFSRLGRSLVSKAHNMRQIQLVLVLLCFFGSMAITNDVALITFVPFTFAVLDTLGAEVRKRQLLTTVCMQTIAANLGSMFTPIGNPQNLYLYGRSGLTLPAFLHLLLPYTALSLLMLIGWVFVSCRHSVQLAPAGICTTDDDRPNDKMTAFYAALFVLCLLTVARVLPYPALLAVVSASVLLFDRKTLGKIDYSLLLTFVGFFIFIGNLGRTEAFAAWLRTALTGREVPIAVLASQAISNVPAALLLSGFTDRTADLIIGTNLGGLGTLMASMASLISYRQIVGREGGRKGRYFVMFTVSNLVFLAVLLLLWLVL